jgi:hypothetical protein
MRTYRRNPKHTEADYVRSQRSQEQNVQEDGQQNKQDAKSSDEEVREEED